MAQASNENTVLGVFDDYNTAERVARDLTNAGIPRESIQVRSNFMTGAAGRSTDVDATDDTNREGGISGFFHRLFGGDDETRNYAGHYAEAVRRGNAVVLVTAPSNQLDRAVEIMNAGGAVDIDRHVERFRQTGYQQYDDKAAPYTHDQAVSERERYRNSNEGATIPVVEEDLQIGKRVVQRGGVRIYSHVVEKPVMENVELREEHVRVERRPVDRPTGKAGEDRFREQSIEVTEMAEEPVVQKRARVREEVVVGKETTKRTEQVRDTVRRTEVEVEKLGKTTDRGTDYRSDFRSDWQTRYGSSGETFESVEPAYNYGYQSANDPRYRGRSWSDVEEDLRTDYLRSNPNSSWDRTKGAVRYGWEKVTGKR
jgi:uncharacterized protein (TIGR02271 family)